MSSAGIDLDALRRWWSSKGYNLWVVGGIILLGALLGLLNNWRVYEEQRVEIFGEVQTAVDSEGSMDEGADASERGEP